MNYSALEIIDFITENGGFVYHHGNDTYLTREALSQLLDAGLIERASSDVATTLYKERKLEPHPGR